MKINNVPAIFIIVPHWIRIGFILLILMVLSQSVFAQNKQFVIEGKFKIDGGSNNGAEILVEKNGQRVKTVEGTSRFEIGLDFDATYVVSFKKEGFVTKKLQFDTRGVPLDRQETGFYPFDFTVEIFEQFDELNMMIFNQPVGQIAYDVIIDEFNYDTDYTKSIQSQIDLALEEVEEKKEEKRQEAEEQEKKEEAINKQVSSLTSAASKNLSSGKAEEAVQNLKEAVKLSDDPAIAEQLKQAETKLADQKDQQKKQAVVDENIDAAESFLAAGNLTDAKKALEEAKKIIESDPRIQKQLDKVNQLIEDQKKNENQIKQLIDEAENALTAGNPELAEQKTKEAVKLGAPVDDLLKRVNDEIQKKKEQQEQLAEKKEKLDDLVDQIKEALKTDNPEKAQELITAAGQLDDSDARLKDLQNQLKEKEIELENQKQQQAQQIEQLTKDAQSAIKNRDPETARNKVDELKKLGVDDIANSLSKQIDDLVKEKEAEKEELANKQKQIDDLKDQIEDAIKDEKLDDARQKMNDLKALDSSLDLIDFQTKIDDLELKAKDKEKQEEANKLAFENALKNANDALQAGNIEDAKKARNEAKDLDNNEEVAKLTDQIDEKEKSLEKQKEKEAQLAEKTNNLLADIQKKLDDGDLKSAKDGVEEAKALKVPNSTLEPFELKIKEQEELAKQKEKNAEQANNLLKQGLAKLEEGDLEGAKTALAGLQELNSPEDATKLQDAIGKAEDSILASQEEQKKQEAEAQRLLTSAQGFLDDSDARGLKDAIDELKKNNPDDENIPVFQKKLSELEDKLKSQEAEKAAAEAAAAELAAKQTEFDDLMKAGKKAFDKSDFDGAKLAYNNALDVFPDNTEAQAGLKSVNDAIAAASNAESAAAEAEKLAQEQEAEKAAAEAAAAELAAKQTEFDDLMKAGKKAFDKSDFDGAKLAYNNALGVFPDNTEAQAGVKSVDDAIAAASNAESAEAEAERLAKEKEELAAKQTEFDDLMKIGKKAFDKSDFDGAKLAYNNALGVFPDNTEAQAGLKSVDDAIASASNAESAAAEAEKLAQEQEAEKAAAEAVAAELAAKQTEFDDLMKMGKKAFDKSDFDGAKLAYNNALGVFPDNTEAQAGLKSVDDAIAAASNAESAEAEAERLAKEKEELAAKQTEFDDLMKAGKKSFDKSDFDGAKLAYNNALGVFPDNTEAQAGLKSVDDAIAAASNAESAEAEAERLAKEKEELAAKQTEFDDLMKAGKKSFDKSDFDGAKLAYNNALGVFPDNTEAQAGLKSVDDAIAAASNAESAEAEAERLAKEKADAEEAEKNAAKEFENRQKLYKNFMKTGASNLEEAEYVQALKNFKNALSLDIDNEEAQKAVNEAESALRAFEKQNEAKSFENKYKNHISDGVLALKRNEFEDAIDAFNKALEMKPTDKTALEGLKRVEEQRIEFEAAEAERLKREARAAKLKQEEFQKAFDAVVAQGDALVEGEKFAPAVVKYDQALKMQDDAGVREKLEEARKGLQRLKDLAEQKSKDAADALAANRPREREQLAEIIEEESDKSRVVSPTGGTSSRPQVRVAQGVLGEDDSRPSTITTAVAVIGKVRSGEAARKSSPAGKMSEEDKYDSQLAIIDRQQSELKATEEQKELQLKYPKRKTIETQEVGNSIVTLIYMNIDNRVTVYKKVEHSWGGVFYFVDDRSTNQRFWEFQTK